MDAPQLPNFPPSDRERRRQLLEQQQELAAATPQRPDVDHTYHPAQYDLPPTTDQEEHFRHGHWKARRQRIRRHLMNSGASLQQMNRWDACGSSCVVEHSKTADKFRLRANYCKSRHCEPCARAKANTIARNLRAKLEQERKTSRPGEAIAIRFITLTKAHTTAPLDHQIRQLYKDFKELRRRPIWKRSQDGGAAVLEVKWTGSAWHPHLHIATAGRWINKFLLSQEWHDVTGDSFVVDVQAMKEVKDTCHYLTKYITKGTSPTVWETDDLAQEYIAATRGLRAANTYGSWRGYQLLAKGQEHTDWKTIASLQKIIEHAQAGQEWARGILLQLRPPGATHELPPNPRPPP